MVQSWIILRLFLGADGTYGGYINIRGMPFVSNVVNSIINHPQININGRLNHPQMIDLWLGVPTVCALSGLLLFFQVPSGKLT